VKPNEVPSKQKILSSRQTLEVDDIKRKLRQIFSFYASYGDRLNIDHLKSSKFKRLMIDTQINKFIN